MRRALVCLVLIWATLATVRTACGQQTISRWSGCSETVYLLDAIGKVRKFIREEIRETTQGGRPGTGQYGHWVEYQVEPRLARQWTVRELSRSQDNARQALGRHAAWFDQNRAARVTTTYDLTGRGYSIIGKRGHVPHEPAMVRVDSRIKRVASSANQVPAAVQRLANNIIRVQASDGSWGSGTYLGDGYALTAHHVVAAGRGVRAHFRTGHTTIAHVVASDREYDQALIWLLIPDKSAKGVKLARSNPKRGEHVIVAGYDHARPDLLWRPGRVRSFSGPGGGAPDWFVIDNQVHSGSSGGPAFTQAGELIGNLWGASPGETISVASGRTQRFIVGHIPFAKVSQWGIPFGAGQSRPTFRTPPVRIAPTQRPTRPTVPQTPPTVTITEPDVAFEVGIVTTIPAGSKARAKLRRGGNTWYLDLDIPEGKTGGQGLQGQAGLQGPTGPAGPSGPKGDKGDPAELDVDALARAIQSALPPLTVNMLNGKGEVAHSRSAKLGGAIDLPPIQADALNGKGQIVDSAKVPIGGTLRIKPIK